MSAGPSPEKTKTYHFHHEWEEDYFFTMNKLKCVSDMLCITGSSKERKS